jgi:sporulation protein YqfC
MRKNRRCRETRNENFIESISKNLDLPQDALAGYAHIELCGNREALIEGCKGILEYSDCAVAINTGKLTVKFCGSDLTITALQDGSTEIKGTITCIDFRN